MVKALKKSGAEVIISSAWDNFPNTLARIRALGLAQELGLSVDDGKQDSTVLMAADKQKVSFTYNQNGNVISVRDIDSKDQYYRNKALAPYLLLGADAAKKKKNIVFVDDSHGNIQAFKEDVARFSLYANAEINYFKLEKPEQDIQVSENDPSVKAMEASIANNKVDSPPKVQSNRLFEEELKSKGWFASTKEQQKVARAKLESNVREQKSEGFYFRPSSQGPDYMTVDYIARKKENGPLSVQSIRIHQTKDSNGTDVLIMQKFYVDTKEFFPGTTFNSLDEMIKKSGFKIPVQVRPATNVEAIAKVEVAKEIGPAKKVASDRPFEEELKSKGWFASTEEQEKVGNAQLRSNIREQKSEGFYFRPSSQGPGYMSLNYINRKKENGPLAKYSIRVHQTKDSNGIDVLVVQDQDQKSGEFTPGMTFDSVDKLIKHFGLLNPVQVQADSKMNVANPMQTQTENQDSCILEQNKESATTKALMEYDAAISFEANCTQLSGAQNSEEMSSILRDLDNFLFPACSFYTLSKRPTSVEQLPALVLNCSYFSMCSKVNEKVDCKTVPFSSGNSEAQEVLRYLNASSQAYRSLNFLSPDATKERGPVKFNPRTCLYIDTYFNTLTKPFERFAMTWQQMHPQQAFNWANAHNVIYGESHDSTRIRKKLIQDLATLRDSGVKTLGVEFLMVEDQKILDEYMLTGNEKLLAPLENKFRKELEPLSKLYFLNHPNVFDVVIAARKSGLTKVVALDTPFTAQLNPDDDFYYGMIDDMEHSSRVKLQNALVAAQLARHADAGGIVVLEGAAHGRGIKEIIGAKRGVFTYADRTKTLHEINFAQGEKLDRFY
ncbi:MAG: hypothetical protein HQK52_06795 [Oligoflexia bacterium]|nr:hypothetical protein [Oligoflexia bacterium]